MSKLPVISAYQCIRALEKAGFYVSAQKGSHIQLRKDEPFRKVTVPNHRELDRRTLKSIVQQSGLTEEEFLHLLKG